jgi:hypothetical protein
MNPIFRVAALTLALALPGLAVAQPSTPDLMIVLDGSGSMWGQIDGVPKIQIARETLSSVLGEANLKQNFGMMVYGHRVRGQCSDIEVTVPLAPAPQSVPQMVISANGLNPIGMTPLTESVRQAADLLRFTEQAATVVLITDGIENCEADPCALGNELASLGLDFRTHVVGFGISEEEGAQVACLAENTGGQFILADNLEALSDALSLTIGLDDDFVAEPDSEPDLTAPRPVQFLFRDVADGPLLFSNVLQGVMESQDPTRSAPSLTFAGQFTGSDISASAELAPGPYRLFLDVANRHGDFGYRERVDFTVEPGAGPVVIDRVLGARLRLVPLVHEGLPYARQVNAISPDLYVTFTPVRDGVPIYDESVTNNVGRQLSEGAYEDRFAPGTWLVRGELFRTFTRERLVEIVSGETTDLIFDFAAAPVFIDIRDLEGFPVARPSLYVYDNPGDDYWTSGGTRTSDGVLVPAYLPVGTWYFDIGRVGGGSDRAQGLVEVLAPATPVTVTVESRQRVDADAAGVMLSPSYQGCLSFSGPGSRACDIEKVAF